MDNVLKEIKNRFIMPYKNKLIAIASFLLWMGGVTGFAWVLVQQGYRLGKYMFGFPFIAYVFYNDTSFQMIWIARILSLAVLVTETWIIRWIFFAFLRRFQKKPHGASQPTHGLTEESLPLKTTDNEPDEVKNWFSPYKKNLIAIINFLLWMCGVAGFAWWLISQEFPLGYFLVGVPFRSGLMVSDGSLVMAGVIGFLVLMIETWVIREVFFAFIYLFEKMDALLQRASKKKQP